MAGTLPSYRRTVNLRSGIADSLQRLLVRLRQFSYARPAAPIFVRWRADFARSPDYRSIDMSKPTHPPMKLSEVIDRLERMREDLLTLQRSLETLEPDNSQQIPTVTKQ